MTFTVNIRQLDDDALRRECERVERVQRRRNAIAGILIVLFIVVAIIVLSEVARAIGSDVRLPFAVR